MTGEIETILARVEAGGRLTLDEAPLVYAHAPLASLGRVARAVRDRHNPKGRATYLVDRNVNYTNVCITDCKFCEFYRPVGHKETYVLTREQLRQKLTELVEVGGTRVLLQGGHHPELRIGWYEELLEFIHTEYPTLLIDAFSPPEIEHIAHLEGFSNLEVLARLKAKGLNGVPGGGGEILDDEIRQIVSPKKTKTAAWIAVMDAAQSLGLYTTASQVFGFGEAPHHRLSALRVVREQQDRALSVHGLGFMAFIAWPLQHESRYGHVFGDVKGWKLGGDAPDYLRHIAFCRVFLDNIPHFQASWPTMGVEVAKEALHMGCDDMGGTMMEENVVSQAGSVHSSAAESILRQAIEDAGLLASKRDSWYRLMEAAS